MNIILSPSAAIYLYLMIAVSSVVDTIYDLFEYIRRTMN